MVGLMRRSAMINKSIAVKGAKMVLLSYVAIWHGYTNAFDTSLQQSSAMLIDFNQTPISNQQTEATIGFVSFRRKRETIEEQYERIYGQWDPGPILDDDMRTCEQRQDCTDCKGPIICAALGMIVIIAFVIALIVDDLRERGLAGFKKEEENIFMTPSQFEHKGPLSITCPQQFHLEAVEEEKEEEQAARPEKPFVFTTHRNVVYDIGAEVEKETIDGE
uniref:Col_cuticle_N domain-containing protein n=1 Tax=Ascaris lumbricoides TaxID=6252 RepID=A0A0M3IRE3_ASCLU